MKLNDLFPSKGSKKNRKRVGRGNGSGLGNTSARGSNGQKSRSGASLKPGFEGGQMPFQRRVPKRGFTNIFRKESEIVNLKDLSIFKDQEIVNIESLAKHNLIKGNKNGVKILANGSVDKALVIQGCALSASAKEKIEAVGGKIEQ